MTRRMVWSANTLAYARLVEEMTYERYTGYTSTILFAHRQTQKAVKAFKVSYARTHS